MSIYDFKGDPATQAQEETMKKTVEQVADEITEHYKIAKEEFSHWPAPESEDDLIVQLKAAFIRGVEAGLTIAEAIPVMEGIDDENKK